MAKDWVLLTSGLTNRSNELSISSGRGLTGRFYFDPSVSRPLQPLFVEVWDRRTLMEQAKVVPSTREGKDDSALVEQLIVDRSSDFGEMFAARLGVYPDSSFISVFQTGGAPTQLAMYVEIE